MAAEQPTQEMAATAVHALPNPARRLPGLAAIATLLVLAAAGAAYLWVQEGPGWDGLSVLTEPPVPTLAAAPAAKTHFQVTATPANDSQFDSNGDGTVNKTDFDRNGDGAVKQSELGNRVSAPSASQGPTTCVMIYGKPICVQYHRPTGSSGSTQDPYHANYDYYTPSSDYGPGIYRGGSLGVSSEPPAPGR